MAKAQERLQAAQLRRSGMSINEIAKKLAVSKSTASLWCRDIPLTKRQAEDIRTRAILAGHKGRILGAAANKQKRLRAIAIATEKGKTIIGKLSERDLLLLGLGLYWGEGSKKSERRFIFVNSDPDILKAIIKWLALIQIPKTALSLQIYINAQHEYRIQKVLSYWSKVLRISKTQFGNPVFIHVPHKKVYANHDTYMGVLHLAVRKSTVLKNETMAMLDAIRAQI